MNRHAPYLERPPTLPLADGQMAAFGARRFNGPPNHREGPRVG